MNGRNKYLSVDQYSPPHGKRLLVRYTVTRIELYAIAELFTQPDGSDVWIWDDRNVSGAAKITHWMEIPKHDMG